MKQAGIGQLVKHISFVGKSILEVYMEEGNEQIVRKAIHKWVGQDTYLPEKELQTETSPAGKSKEEMEKCIMFRATLLCARNPSKNFQECILSNIAMHKREEILLNARTMREEWIQKTKTQKEQPGEANKGKDKNDTKNNNVYDDKDTSMGENNIENDGLTA